MRSLEDLLRQKKKIRVIGYDDAPFEREGDDPVCVAGVVCADTRFEGMVWGQVTKDGDDATEKLQDLLMASKFYEQVNAVLTDGIALGGFNIVDLPQLAANMDRPCIAVMRHHPDMDAVDKALQRLPHYAARKGVLQKAGTIYSQGTFFYQVSGCHPDTAAAALDQLTDRGNVPEALRLAHIIGAAIINGQSGKRA